MQTIHLLIGAHPQQGAQLSAVFNDRRIEDHPLSVGVQSAAITLTAIGGDECKLVGSAMFAALATHPQLRALLAEQIAASGDTFSLRLHVQVDPADLRSLPWEALYQDPAGFLALNSASIARYIAIAGKMAKPIVTQLPLRVLAVSASPADLPPLNFQAERQNMTEVVTEEAARGWVQLEFVEHARRDSLRETLLKFRPHVLHFSGHGKFSEGKSSLAFEDAYGDSDTVNAEAVALLFGNIPELRLVVLNACETAIDSTAQPLTGIAPKILQRTGVSAVVAMQAPIGDRAAIAFSRAFYGQVAEGQLIDHAMREGRLAIFNAEGGRGSFAVPVLFMSSHEGLLIEFPQQRRNRVVAQARQSFASARTDGTPDSTTRVMARWQVQLGTAAKSYRRLAAWKALHDYLHTINESLTSLSLEIARLDKTQPDFNFVADQWAAAQTPFRRLTEFARDDAGSIAAQRFSDAQGNLTGEPWVVEVMVAARNFGAALAESDAKNVSLAARKLAQTVQTHMNAADKALRDIVSDLVNMSERWQESSQVPGIPQMENAIRELIRLHVLLGDAAEKHDMFQELDNDFARLRDETRRAVWDWETISATWAFCRADVLDSRFIPYARNSGELAIGENSLAGAEWCVEIVRLAGALDGQLDAEEQGAVRNTVRALGAAIRTHFFIADKELRDLTQTLDSMSDELLDILGAK